MSLEQEILDCKICYGRLPHDPKPIFLLNRKARIAIVGHAPGIKAHESQKPFMDRSGETLRDWLGVNDEIFYKEFAIIPMGFCYPGKSKTGDLPPRKECAPHWHGQIWKKMTSLELVIYLGAHAQNYYLDKKTLTERVKNINAYLPKSIPLPHPSPRNNIWQKKNPWFQEKVLPLLKKSVSEILI